MGWGDTYHSQSSQRQVKFLKSEMIASIVVARLPQLNVPSIELVTRPVIGFGRGCGTSCRANTRKAQGRILVGERGQSPIQKRFKLKNNGLLVEHAEARSGRSEWRER